MSTVEEIARQALAAVDSTANFLLAAQWVNERYANLCSRVRFRHLRKTGRLTTAPIVDAGTVTVARGDTIVVGDATAQAAWSNVLVGRYFRGKTVWFKIVQVTSTPDLVLDEPYSETDITAGAYKIVQRQVPLDPSARQFGRYFVHARLRRPLDMMTLDEMDIRMPERQLVSPPPTIFAQTEDVLLDGKRVLAVELYPYPSLAETILYNFWQEPPRLKRDDFVPSVIDDNQLKEGVLVDIMRHNASNAANAGEIEKAAYWRNEYRSQETRWEKYVLEVARNDKGIDDLTALLSLARSIGGSFYDIQTSRDEVFSRGIRP